MRILAIETTGNAASVAVVDEEKLIGQMMLNHKKTHSQTVMPLIKSLLDMIEISMEEIDYIACSQGPGSFTGLRIGAATAKGLAHGASKKIVPVPTLDSLAYNIFDLNRIIAPIMDARRNQVYTAFYKRNGGKQERIRDFFADDINSVLEDLQEYEEDVVFLGDGVYAYQDIIRRHNPRNALAPQNLNLQSAASIGSMAFSLLEDGKAVMPEEFELFYLRQSQAEREYANRKEL